MQKKKIYFIQPNSMLGNSVYLPYAAGVLSCYALSFQTVNEQYELGGIVFKEDSEENILKSVISPFFIGFSTYFWNYDYNLRIAALLKKRYPDCFIAFGGHQISREKDLLSECDFIDCLMFGEGEEPFRQLLEYLAAPLEHSIAEIPNLAFRQNGKTAYSVSKPVCASVYPSPYEAGVFDRLLNLDDSIELNAQLETNRGCPYHCSYCDWCEYDLPMRKFPIERIKNDLNWISEHKISYCMCIDSNFGLFPRDEEIADYAVELKRKTGYPDKFGACFAKDKTERIFNINKKFSDAKMSKGASLAFQSMSTEVLKNVSRDNMNKENLSKQLKLYREAGIPTYTELILGLPGETLDSFKSGVCELLELGQHDAINVFRCEIYPNSLLASREYMEKFKIKTTVSRLNMNHCKMSDCVFSGGLEYISETSTMSHDDLVNAVLFSSLVQGVHCHGLMQYISIYMHDALSLSYIDIYDRFLRYFIKDEGLIGSALRQIRQSIYNNDSGKIDTDYINRQFSDITWPYDEALFLQLAVNLDNFYEEIGRFVPTLISADSTLEDLMLFQRSVINLPGRGLYKVLFKYNWAQYFNDAVGGTAGIPEQIKSSIVFIPDCVCSNWKEYSHEIVWYGRRNRRSLCRFEEKKS